MAEPEPDTDALLDRAAGGDAGARNLLLARHRRRLRELIAVRMDRRLAARIDPSDVVQESLVEADRRLDAYLAGRPLPFYPWLRRLALERLIDLHRRHVRSQKRSVRREVPLGDPLPGESLHGLAERLLDQGSSPSAGLHRDEERARLVALLEGLPSPDRELLVLRHLEHLSVRDIAAVLGLSEGAVKVRHVRALARLRELLGPPSEEATP
jgi:RNA polymerase sigma-70 factor (ECF subfamily)